MLVTPLIKLPERLISKDQFDYLSALGSLLHLSNCVRCVIATAVGILARHAATPGPQHVTALKRVLMYLFNTKSLGITYSRSSSSIPLVYENGKHPLDDGTNPLTVFADSDYAMDSTRRSTMGYVIMLCGGPIAWSSVLGKTVATSTCEAEINAAVFAAKDGLHINRLLSDLGIIPATFPIRIAEDNSAAIAHATAELRHIRNAKHYEVKLRWLQQLVVDEQVEFIYCPTSEQCADFFTKPLDLETFVRFRDILMAPSGP